MDLSKTIIAKSDQLNADDLIGPRRPSPSSRSPGTRSSRSASCSPSGRATDRSSRPRRSQRILAYCWGSETDDWPPGRAMTLFRDEKVKWAGEEVGGIRVSHLSHIKGPQKIALQESKHKKTLHTILPLPDAPPAGMQESIPPIFAQHVGTQLLADLQSEAAA
jgi:hypothetical protein